MNRDLLDVVSHVRTADARPLVVATIVATRGSSYRRPGALAVVDGERVVGTLSGGCLEGDLIERARDLRAPVLVRYDLDDDELVGLGLGCGGTIEILLEPIGPWFRATVDAIEGRRRGTQAIALEPATLGARAIVDEHGVETHGRVDPALVEACRHVDRPRTLEEPRAFVAPLPRRRRLVVCGAGDDARPLVEAARAIGLVVELWDRRPARLGSFRSVDVRREISIDALASATATVTDAIVVMNHHLGADREALRGLSSARPVYVGVLGPKQRTAALLAELGLDLGDALHAPAGLDLGADDPAAVALAIVAEIHAVFAGRSGGKLRERKGPIHGG